MYIYIQTVVQSLQIFITLLGERSDNSEVYPRDTFKINVHSVYNEYDTSFSVLCTVPYARI